jgi:hypothetical protein
MIEKVNKIERVNEIGRDDGGGVVMSVVVSQLYQ